MNSANLYAALSDKRCKDFVNVGPATASKLLVDYGGAFTAEELLDHLRNRNKEALLAVKGINEKIILGLFRGAMVLDKKLELSEFLDKAGLPHAIVNKLYALWGNRTIEKIRRNPYILLCVFDWKIIDPIGLSLGDVHHPCRLVGAVESCMYADYEQDKNTCISPSRLVEKVLELLGCDIAVAEQAVIHAQRIGAVIRHGNVLQIPAAFSYERQMEIFLAKNRRYDIPAEAVHSFLRDGEYCGLTEEQEAVVVNALQNHISAFYGRGGRGKTFTLSALCAAASAPQLGNKNYSPLHPILSAVAAKACQRIKKETGREAMTIAKILYRLERRHLENKIVIVDEASMLSLSDAYHLIKKIPDSSRLVFLGDHGQIPSVDAGKVFYDVISSKAIPTVELTINQRQDEKTDKQLETILSGAFPVLDDYRPGVKTGLYKCVVKDVFAAEEKAMELYGHLNGQAQLISPLNKEYAGGSEAINNMIHRRYYGRQGFCAKTPIIFTKNMTVATRTNGQTVNLTNGSMGVVKQVLKQNPTHREPYMLVDFEFEGEVILTWAEADDYLEMAYCLTCHKAQGSDWGTVIVVLPHTQLVDRNLIYTALSRCKERAILVYYDHKYVATRISEPAAHERRRSTLLRGGDV